MSPLLTFWAPSGPAIAVGLVVSAGLCAAIGHRGAARWLGAISLIAGGVAFAAAIAIAGAALPVRVPVSALGAAPGVEAWLDHFSAFTGGLILWICAPCLALCLARTGAAGAGASGVVGALMICAGAMFAATLGDMISLWLALTLAGFGAVALAADRPQSSAGAFRFLMVSGAGGVLHAVGVVLVITAGGTPALLGGVLQVARTGDDALLAAGVSCVFVGAIAQAGLFPFHSVLEQAVDGAPRGGDQALVMILGLATLAVLARWIQALGGGETAGLAPAVLWFISAWGALGALAGAAQAARGGEVRAILRNAFSGALMVALMMLATGGRVGEAGLLWLAGAVTGAGAAAIALDAAGFDDTVTLDRLEGFAVRSPLMAATFGVGFAGIGALPLTPSFVAAFEAMGALLPVGEAVRGLVIAAVLALLTTAALRVGERAVRRAESGRGAALQRGSAHLVAAILALVLIVAAWTVRPLNDLALLAATGVVEQMR